MATQFVPVLDERRLLELRERKAAAVVSEFSKGNFNLASMGRGAPVLQVEPSSLDVVEVRGGQISDGPWILELVRRSDLAHRLATTSLPATNQVEVFLMSLGGVVVGRRVEVLAVENHAAVAGSLVETKAWEATLAIAMFGLLVQQKWYRNGGIRFEPLHRPEASRPKSGLQRSLCGGR